MLLGLISRGKRKPAQFHAGIQSCGSDCARRAACRALVMLLHVLMDQDEFKLFREVKLFIFFEDKFLPVGAVCSNLFFPPLIVTETIRQHGFGNPSGLPGCQQP